MRLIELAEQRRLPDWLIRVGIRHLLRQRLADEKANDAQAASQRKVELIASLRQSPIAIETAAANQQHYEVPTAFYRHVLGSHFKYSGCWWDKNTQTLDQAEVAMLARYVERGHLENGQDVLELGCGWGSMSLYLAAQFPDSQITAVSNSHSQREFIEQQAGERGLNNLQVMTCDVNELTLDKQFDRIVSVEMFEHMRNYQRLLDKVGSWLREDGKLLVHIFCHQTLLYPFDTAGDANWMGQYFFTGGVMPSVDTLLHFQDALQLEQYWLVNGRHYQRTAEAWLANTDRHAQAIINLFESVYGKEQATLWWQRWRMFFMACAELFGYRDGNEWLVGHYLFNKRTG